MQARFVGHWNRCQVNETIINPLLSVEVISLATEKYDQGKKAEYHHRFASLQSYLLVDQGRVYVEHYRRQADQTWAQEIFNELSAWNNLPAVELVIPLANIYDKIRFEESLTTPPD